MGDSVTPNGARRIYRALCHLAWCDGELADKERAFLAAFRAEHGISDAEGDELMDEARSGEKLGLGRRGREQELLIETMIDLAMADGVLATAEQKRLLKLGKTLGVSEQELAKKIHERVLSRGKKLKPGEGVAQ